MSSAVNLITQNVLRNISIADNNMMQSMRRLVSGFRINTAADDPSGMSVVERMRTQLRSVNQATRNAHDAISLIHTAEGGISSIVEMIQRMRELVIIAANDTNPVHPERERIQLEIDHLTGEIDEVVRRTEFNTMRLLDGRFARPPASSRALAEPIGQLMAVSPSAVTAISPHIAMPASPTVINAENIAAGSGNGWVFSGGVLTISGGGDFRVDGFFIEGQQLMNINRIVVSDSAETNLTLNNVSITTASGFAGGSALDVGGANVNLFLLGNNVLDASGSTGQAGIRTTGGTLTIQGSGALNVRSGHHAAGIGGSVDGSFMGETGGTLIIRSGTINARGSGGAGIGGGGGYAGGDGGNITIHGGNVTAYNIFDGAGIGGGGEGNGGVINITGGIVEAIGGGSAVPGNTNRGAAIGGGNNAAGANLIITGGLVEIRGNEWIGGGTGNLTSGTTDVRGGNLSINPNNIHSGVTHFGQDAFRVQITLEGQGGNLVAFGSRRDVSYILEGLSVRAITDSAGNLFMYLPVAFTDREAFMNFLGNAFENIVEMSPNHDNRLVLRFTGSIDHPPYIPTEGRVLHFQVGPNTGHSMFLHIDAMHTRALGLRDRYGNQIINVMQESGQDISMFLDRVNNALDIAVRERSRMGAAINRLEFTVESLYVAGDNLSAALSRMRDADMAAEMMNLVQSRLSVDVGMHVLARLHNQEGTARLLDILG